MRKRFGWTTIELMIVVTIGSVLSAGVLTVLRRQQRFFATATGLIEQRVSLRDATAILPSELRMLAPGDVIAFSDTSLDVRVTIGTSVVCDTLAGSVALVAPGAGTDPQLTTFATTPQPGDLALLYDTGSATSEQDDGWVPFEIAGLAPNASACAVTPFVDRSNLTIPLQLRFAGGVLPPTVSPGTFVRILRRVRYRFYRAGTGDWYLGYAEWSGSAFGVVQPVSGPFAAYSRGAGGLTLRYLDASGAQVVAGDDPRLIARVGITVRGATREALSSPRVRLVDSQSITVHLRNR